MSRRGPRSLRERLRSLYRWHRWIGLLAAPLILMLVVTGIALNHVDELSLDRRYVDSPRLLARYGIRAEGPVTGIQTPAGWLAAYRGRLYLDGRRVARFEDELVSAAVGPMLAVLGRHEWLLLTSDGTLVERQDISALPTSPQGFRFVDRELQLSTQAARWVTPDIGLSWRRLDGAPEPVDAPRARELPESLADAVRRDSLEQRVTLARLLGDLHSGRLFGRAGVWFVDAAAILLLLLALSGPALWWRQYRRRRR